MQIELRNQENRVLMLLCTIAILFSFFDINYLIIGLMVALFIWICASCNLTIVISSYLFLTIWERCTSLPVFSGILIIRLFLFVFILVSTFKCTKRIKLFDFCLFVLLAIVGLISFLNTKNFAGLLLAFDAFSISYLHIFLNDNRNVDFWKIAFRFIYYSALISIFWGLVQGSWASANLYISNEYILWLTSTIGTDRSCMLFCTGLIYPLFYMEKNIKRIMCCSVFLVAMIMTFSLTAIVCLLLFVSVYLIFEYRQESSKTKLWILLGIILFLAWFAYIWAYGSSISAINTIVDRIKNTLFYLQNGQLDRVTTNRSILWKQYLELFRSFSLWQQLFGSGVIDAYTYFNMTQYVHNTYIDMLIYFGIVPMLLLIILLIRNIFSYRYSNDFAPILLFKVCYLFTAASVSMLTASYWWIMVII